MDARFVREGVAPDNSLVRLDRLAREFGQQLARLVQRGRVDARVVGQTVVTYPERHDQFLE